MKCKGKSVEVTGSKALFGKETLWVHVLEDNSFLQVLRSDLVEDDVNSAESGMAYVRYISIAARIQANLQVKAERKLKALKYVEHRLHRIGIKNVRKAKIKKLQAQRESWENAFAQGGSVAPDVKHILTVRIDG